MNREEGRFLPRPTIAVVTNRRLVPGVDALVAFAARAAGAGVELIHVRERDLPDRDLLSLVRQITGATDGTPAAVVVNERADVAMAGGAAGVHLRGDSVPAARVRAIVPPRFAIGRSVHSAGEAMAAERDGGLDYLVFGPVFETATKPGARGAGLGALEEVCRAVRLPVLAIGGVQADRAGELKAAGAAGIAAINMFVDADAGPGGLDALVGRLRRAFDT
jgi:thiamine-phosphate diphosphorylase